MIPTLKFIGLAALAALALSAVAASAAQAQKGTFTTGLTDNGLGQVEHTASTVHAVQIGGVASNYLESNGVKISCTDSGVTYDVTQTGEEQTQTSGTDDSLTVTPHYEECGTVNGEGEIPVHNITITMNGCHYDLNQPETIKEEQYTGTVTLNCPTDEGPQLHIFLNEAHTIQLCTTSFEADQGGPLNHVIYTNEDNGEAPDTVKAHATIEGLKYINTSGTCPGGEGTREDGKLEATATITSTEEHDFWISDNAK